MNSVLDKLLNLIYCNDIKCIACNSELESENKYCLCEKCLKNLPFNTKFCKVCGTAITGDGVLCESCKNIQHDFNLSRSIFVFEDKIIKLVHDLKYNNAKFLKDYLSNILYDFYLKTPEINNVDIIIPVPLNINRQKERGFNQSELLLSTFVNNKLNVRKDILERVINTQTQTNLSREERLTNLNKAFKVNNKSEIKNKSVLVVDDVFTTGSTINECAKTLKRAGARCVFGLTLACANFYGKKNTKMN